MGKNFKSGHVKWYNMQKGYGFIVQEDGSDIFFHFSGISKEVPGGILQEGQPVTYEIKEGKKGQLADKVKLVNS